MPRGKVKVKPEKSKLLQALEFLSVCQKNDAPNDSQMYCNIQNKAAVAFDGVIAAGIAVDEDLNACPHTKQMALALNRCGESFQIVQLSPESLKISSEAFEAYIPCCQRERLTAVNPDAGTMPVSPSLSAAIQAAAPLVSDKADVLEAVSIQLNANSVLATNRKLVMEVWHCSNLPFGELLIPKAAAVALTKIDKKVTAIGYNDALTFWFEDGSWMRTQLHKGKWRDNATKMLKLPTDEARTILPSFFDSVAKVLPFSDDGKVYCGEGKVSSHYKDYKGAGYSLPVKDGPNMKVYDGKSLMFVGKYCSLMDESQDKNSTMFYGNITRCAVWHDTLIVDDENIPF